MRRLVLKTVENSMTDTVLLKLKENIVSRNIFELFLDRVEEDEVRKRIKELALKKPLLGKKCLGILHINRIKDTLLKWIFIELDKNERMGLVLVTGNKEVYDLMKFENNDRNIFINLNKPNDSIIEAHLKLVLNKDISMTAFETFKNRMKNQWKFLDLFTEELLLIEGEITSKVIENTIPKAQPLELDRIISAILLGESPSKSFKTLSNFKYAHKYIMKELRKKIDTYIRLKKDFLSGELSNKNIIEYSKTSKINYWEIEKFFQEINSKCSLRWLIKIKYKLLARGLNQTPVDILLFLEELGGIQ